MDRNKLKSEIEFLASDMAYLADLSDAIRASLNHLIAQLEKSEALESVRTPTVADIMDLKLPHHNDSLAELNFCWQQVPIRVRRVLKHYKIKKPAQLMDLTVRHIKRVPNAGAQTIEAIRDLCAKYGLDLKDR